MHKYLQKVVDYICSVHPELDKDQYATNLNRLYGKIYELDSDSPDYSGELVDIELSRAWCRSKSLVDPVDLLQEYSTISEILALKSLKTDEIFVVATVLQDLVSNLYESELDKTSLEHIRVLVSESELDFGYAAGNHCISSMRLGHVIRLLKMNPEEAAKFFNDKD